MKIKKAKKKLIKVVPKSRKKDLPLNVSKIKNTFKEKKEENFKRQLEMAELIRKFKGVTWKDFETLATKSSDLGYKSLATFKKSLETFKPSSNEVAITSVPPNSQSRNPPESIQVVGTPEVPDDYQFQLDKEIKFIDWSSIWSTVLVLVGATATVFTLALISKLGALF
jgi:hypothetical protein